MFNMDVAGFFTKWLGDLAADQLEDGRIPHVVPDVIGGFGSAAWADAGVIIPWTLYLHYADRRILERQYASMKAWVDYVTRTAGDNHLWNSGFHYGDWLAYNTTRSDYPGATTDKDLIATALFAYSTQLLGRTAEVLGKNEDTEHCRRLLANIREAFNREFVTPNGRLSSNTQTAYTLALSFDLLPEALRSQAAERLVRDIEAFDNHLTTGFVGTPYLCHVLSRFGHLDTAYTLLNQKTYPSWLYPVTKGATTIWERWDGIKPDGSFQDAGMNSFNHYAYGAIGDWLYRVVAGIEIDPQHPGYKHVFIRPRPGGDLNWVAAQLNTLFGEIKSKWNRETDHFQLVVQIPTNTEGTIRLPGARLEEVSESGVPLSRAAGVSSAEQVGDAVLVQVGSGSYDFSYVTSP
jgi:alpha-L-rhamnosidase